MIIEAETTVNLLLLLVLAVISILTWRQVRLNAAQEDRELRALVGAANAFAQSLTLIDQMLTRDLDKMDAQTQPGCATQRRQGRSG